jgi:cytochrome c553
MKLPTSLALLLAISPLVPLHAETPLQPNISEGQRIYRNCSICHQPEGWGTEDGIFPQISGQHLTVIIKQLEDIRSHKRNNKIMDRFTAEAELRDAQDILNVASYITNLPMTLEGGKGPGTALKRGNETYRLRCLSCHGRFAEGDAERTVPLLAGQHFLYLKRQFEAIRNGKRGNGDPEMIQRTKDVSKESAEAVLDYISRLSPAKEKIAPTGWKNPGQTNYTQDLTPGLRF